MPDTNVCKGCGTCCSHVALEIDTPKSKEDFQEIVWFVMHQNVAVFVDHDSSWNLEFNTPCNSLTDKRLCSVYKDRPAICRGYSAGECESNGKGKYYKHIFRTRDDVLKYIKKHTTLKNISPSQ